MMAAPVIYTSEQQLRHLAGIVKQYTQTKRNWNVVGHAEGISVTRQGDWRGVYIGNVERDTPEGGKE